MSLVSILNITQEILYPGHLCPHSVRREDGRWICNNNNLIVTFSRQLQASSLAFVLFLAFSFILQLHMDTKEGHYYFVCWFCFINIAHHLKFSTTQIGSWYAEKLYFYLFTRHYPPQYINLSFLIMIIIY